MEVSRAARAAFATLLLALVAAASAAATTTDELSAALRKSRLPDEADRVASLRGAVEESEPDFLNGGSYVVATLEGALRPEVHRYVRQKGRLVPLGTGEEGRLRITREVDLRISSEDSALAYVRWLLEVTRENGVWLVSSVEDVPFVPVPRKEKERHQALDAQRRALEGTIQPPRVEPAGPLFVVHHDAITNRTLVRYAVKVTRLGLPTVSTEIVARDLPVVYAGPR